MINSALGTPQSSLESILSEVHKNPPFSLSPRYIDFRPSGDLKKEIDDYVGTKSPAHLEELKTELFNANDAYVALACIFMITHFEKTDVQSCLKDYNAFLNGKPAFQFTQKYPGRKEVLDEVNAILSSLQDQQMKGGGKP